MRPVPRSTPRRHGRRARRLQGGFCATRSRVAADVAAARRQMPAAAELQRGGRSSAAEAEGIDHRRVLGDDDGGRRQSSAPAISRGRGRRSGHPTGRDLGALQHLGAPARHAPAIPVAKVEDEGHAARLSRARTGPDEAPAPLGRRRRPYAPSLVSTHAIGLEELPSAGHGPGGDHFAPVLRQSPARRQEGQLRKWASSSRDRRTAAQAQRWSSAYQSRSAACRRPAISGRRARRSLTARYPEAIFVAIETTGDGEDERAEPHPDGSVQGAEARRRGIPQQPPRRGPGLSETAIAAKASRHGRALHHPPHVVAGTAANQVLELAGIGEWTA